MISNGVKILAKNKKAYFNYEILEKFETGVSLLGQEVKSIKSGRINLAGSYVVLRQTGPGKSPEVFLIGANVPAYQPKNAPSDYEPERSRKLLLKKKEIKYLIGKTKQKGLTLAPLSVYSIKGKIKFCVGLCKGKKKLDKRQTIKEKEVKRKIQRELKKRG